MAEKEQKEMASSQKEPTPAADKEAGGEAGQKESSSGGPEAVAPVDDPDNEDLIVVGIGASAGGI